MPSDSFAAEADRIRQRVMDTLLSAFSALSEGLAHRGPGCPHRLDE
jgi:hypothetical protein